MHNILLLISIYDQQLLLHHNVVSDIVQLHRKS